MSSKMCDCSPVQIPILGQEIAPFLALKRHEEIFRIQGFCCDHWPDPRVSELFDGTSDGFRRKIISAHVILCHRA